MRIENIYSKFLLLSRNTEIFNNYINDNLDNKIIVFFIHLSLFFNQINEEKNNLRQDLFDYIFYRIETDLREIGHGDMSVNKKMKILITKFYSILVDFQNFNENNDQKKRDILKKYFVEIKNIDNFSNYLVVFFKTNYKDIDLT